jgi:hypothetical protein
MGGQTGLNTALALFKDGTLDKYGVKMIGADAEAIEKAEDRLKFREAMDKIGLESPRSKIAHSLDEALEALEFVGLPTIIRPSFTLLARGFIECEFQRSTRKLVNAIALHRQQRFIGRQAALLIASHHPLKAGRHDFGSRFRRGFRRNRRLTRRRRHQHREHEHHHSHEQQGGTLHTT